MDVKMLHGAGEREPVKGQLNKPNFSVKSPTPLSRRACDWMCELDLSRPVVEKKAHIALTQGSGAATQGKLTGTNLCHPKSYMLKGHHQSRASAVKEPTQAKSAFLKMCRAGTRTD